MNMQKIREQYPQYQDLPDEQLARGLHQKHYADMPFEEFSAKIGLAQVQPTSFDPTEGMSTSELVLAGIGKGFVDVGRGVGQLVGLVDEKDIERARELDAPLMRTTAGKTGSVIGQGAATLPAAFVPGANTLVGASIIGAGIGAAQPIAEDESRLSNTAFGAAGGAAGQQVGKYIGQAFTNRATKKAAEAATAKAQNAPRDAVVQAAKEAGYVMPPSQVNPSKINNALEGLAGKLSTAQHASARNQATTNRLVRKALGVPEDVPLTPEALKGIRDAAGQSYEAVKGAGRMKADNAFIRQLDDLKGTFEGAAKDFPALARAQVTDELDALKVDQFGADSAIDAIRVLRDKADTAFRQGDGALAKALKGASGALEELVERNLRKTDQSQLLRDFRNARKLIAKTYSVEKALNPSTGNVRANVLASELGRKKPLSGEIKQVAQFAQAFPKASREITDSLPGLSPLDYGMGIMSGAAFQNPLAMAAVGARPAARAAILSKPYQSLVQPSDYSLGLLERTLPGLLSDRRAVGAAGLLGAGGSVHAAQ